MVEVEIANPEYIHEVVAKFVDDLINRRIYLALEDIHKRKDPEYITNAYGTFTKLLTMKYFDMKIIGKDRAELEKSLFDYIVIFTSFMIILPSKIDSTPVIEKRIDKIEQKLDSTNKLLMNILTILQKVSEDDDEP